MGSIVSISNINSGLSGAAIRNLNRSGKDGSSYSDEELETMDDDELEAIEIQAELDAQAERDAAALAQAREDIRVAIDSPRINGLGEVARSLYHKGDKLNGGEYGITVLSSDISQLGSFGSGSSDFELSYYIDLPRGVAETLNITDEEYWKTAREELRLGALSKLDAIANRPHIVSVGALDDYISSIAAFDRRLNPDGNADRYSVMEEFGISDDHLAHWKAQGFTTDFNQYLDTWQQDRENCAATSNFNLAARDTDRIYKVLHKMAKDSGIDFEDKGALEKAGVKMDAFNSFLSDRDTLKYTVAHPTMAGIKTFFGFENGCN